MKRQMRLFSPFVRLLSLLFCFFFFVPPFFFATTCSHFHVDLKKDDDDEALNLRFFVPSSFVFCRISPKHPLRLFQLHRINQSLFLRTTTTTQSRLWWREYNHHFCAAKGKERRRFFLRLVQKKTFCLLRSRLFSIIVRRRGRKEDINGVVWLERIRLIGQGDAIKKGGALGTKR